MDKRPVVRDITVVGGGQAGLMLAIGLRRRGHVVRLVQDRTAAEIAQGRVLSSQCLFASALQLERSLGLDLWTGVCPAIEGVRVDNPAMRGIPAINFTGRLRSPAQSVDQRLKFPAWLELFERLGGALEIRAVDLDALEVYARKSELVVVASGKGALSELFALDPRRSPFSRPLRSLAMLYLRGGGRPQHPSCIYSTAVPGAGGLILLPALTLDGACEILFFEALPEGPLDVARPHMNAEEQWSVMHAALALQVPAEAERLASACPSDAQAFLSGRIIPAVRHAVGRLPSERPILGLGDAVVLNDPLLGQGANCATKAAAVYLEAICLRGHQAFDAAWMESTALAAWQRTRAATYWTHLSLLPPQPAAIDFLLRACNKQSVADAYAHGFDEPETLLPLLLGKEAA